MGAVIRESTATLGADALDDARALSMRADDFLARVVDRLLRRHRPRRTEMPAGLPPASTARIPHPGGPGPPLAARWACRG